MRYFPHFFFHLSNRNNQKRRRKLTRRLGWINYKQFNRQSSGAYKQFIIGDLIRGILCQSVFIGDRNPSLLGYEFSGISLISAELHHSNTRASRPARLADPIDNSFVAILDGKPIAMEKKRLQFFFTRSIRQTYLCISFVKPPKFLKVNPDWIRTETFPAVYQKLLFTPNTTGHKRNLKFVMDH